MKLHVGQRIPQRNGRVVSTHNRHALKVNAAKFKWNVGDGVFIEGGKNDDIPGIIEKLMNSGAFTSADKMGLQALAPDTLRALATKFADHSEAADTDDDEVEADEEDLRMNSADEDHEDFIHCGRPKSMRRELPETRARRNQRAGLLAPTRRRK